MNIWAHRGCSQRYPENTITAFEKAINIPGLAGIELDIQLTRDGEIVVIHDERVDRTTDGIGFVRDYSLAELKMLHIHTENEMAEHIPTMRDVLELLKTEMTQGDPGLRLNIELKNGVYTYPDMEEKIIDLVYEHGIQDSIVYSSFYAESLATVHALDPAAEIGVLDRRVSDCLYKARGLECTMTGNIQSDLGRRLAERLFNDGIENSNKESETEYSRKPALHPSGTGIDISADRLADYTVRAWFGAHLYPEKPTDGRMDLERLAAAGVTDVFLNEPEKYL